MRRIKKAGRKAKNLIPTKRQILSPLDNVAISYFIKQNKNSKQQHISLMATVSELWNERYSLNILDRIQDIESFKNEISNYRKNKGKDNKIAVVTAIANNYDSIKIPDTLDGRIDYYLFTDKPVDDYGVHSVLPMLYTNDDPTRSARYIKTHLNTLLDGYDYIVWVDANILLSGNIHDLIDRFRQSKKEIAVFEHPFRQNITEEVDACIKLNKDDKEVLKLQLASYKKQGLDNGPLVESGFMIFNMNSKKIDTFFNSWWSEIDKFSKRDQISLSYVIAKHKLSTHVLSSPSGEIRNHTNLLLAPHGSSSETLNSYFNKKLKSKKVDPYLIKNSNSKPRSANTDIVVCVHNALKEVKQCLKSIENHKKNNHNLIIVDDGSEEETAKYLKNFSKGKKWTSIIRNEVAKGYTKAANLGIKNSNSEFVILLNSDTIVTKDWAEKMYQAVVDNKGVEIVGPLSNAASVQSIPDFRSKNKQTAINEMPKNYTVDDMNEFCENLDLVNYALVPLVHGFCLGITRKAINTLGGFDEENFPNGYGEENDFCVRASNAGLGMAITTNTYIYHHKSKSYDSERRIRLMKEGSESLFSLHSKARIDNAVKSMVSNPVLVKVRAETKKLF